jgi:hypothetical protein
MAKAKLSALTQNWVSGKTEKHQNIKTLKNKDIKTSKTAVRRMQTVYLGREATRLLWQTRVETGATLSSTIETLILTHLKK